MKQIILYFAFLIINSTSIFTQNIFLKDVSFNPGISIPIGKYKEIASHSAGYQSKGSALPYFTLGINGSFNFYKSILLSTDISFFTNKIDNKGIAEQPETRGIPYSGDWKSIYIGFGPQLRFYIKDKSSFISCKLISGIMRSTFPKSKIFLSDEQNTLYLYSWTKSSSAITPFVLFGLGFSLKPLNKIGLSVKTEWVYAQPNFKRESYTLFNYSVYHRKQIINVINTSIGVVYYLNKDISQKQD